MAHLLYSTRTVLTVQQQTGQLKFVFSTLRTRLSAESEGSRARMECSGSQQLTHEAAFKCAWHSSGTPPSCVKTASLAHPGRSLATMSGLITRASPVNAAEFTAPHCSNCRQTAQCFGLIWAEAHRLPSGLGVNDATRSFFAQHQHWKCLLVLPADEVPKSWVRWIRSEVRRDGARGDQRIARLTTRRRSRRRLRARTHYFGCRRQLDRCSETLRATGQAFDE